jgi:phosphoglycerate dehydrogenase-like enzyme
VPIKSLLLPYTLFLSGFEVNKQIKESKRRLADAILAPCMARPRLLISALQELFASFFSDREQRWLDRNFVWNRVGGRTISPEFRRQLGTAEAIITTWDSPCFDDSLEMLAPRLRIIAHCGGEVKSRFARPLFEQMTITNAAEPMARATAELGAAFLLYCARNVDFYRSELKKPSNRIYDQVHVSGASESLAGKTVAMIGFGRIGRALVDLLRGFDLQWLVHDPYADRVLAKKYSVKFLALKELLAKAHLLVLTAALTDQTRGILRKEGLAKLPDGAAVINIARGGLIDLQALRQEVKRGRLRCAIDVTDPLEPLPVGDSLRKMPGAIVTPHIAGSGRHVREEIARVVLDDLEKFFHGKRVGNRVTVAMLDRMT